MKKFKVGQKVRIIGDSFKQDPHELPIGSVHVIKKIQPPIKVEELHPFVREFLKIENGGKPLVDFPERIYVSLNDGESYANIVFEDVELVEDDFEEIDYSQYRFVKVLQDCVVGGFRAGQTYEIKNSDVWGHYFEDNDGDVRTLSSIERDYDIELIK